MVSGRSIIQIAPLRRNDAPEPKESPGPTARHVVGGPPTPGRRLNDPCAENLPVFDTNTVTCCTYQRRPVGAGVVAGLANLSIVAQGGGRTRSPGRRCCRRRGLPIMGTWGSLTAPRADSVEPTLGRPTGRCRRRSSWSRSSHSITVTCRSTGRSRLHAVVEGGHHAWERMSSAGGGGGGTGAPCGLHWPRERRSRWPKPPVDHANPVLQSTSGVVRLRGAPPPRPSTRVRQEPRWHTV